MLFFAAASAIAHCSRWTNGDSSYIIVVIFLRALAVILFAFFFVSVVVRLAFSLSAITLSHCCWRTLVCRERSDWRRVLNEWVTKSWSGFRLLRHSYDAKCIATDTTARHHNKTKSQKRRIKRSAVVASSPFLWIHCLAFSWMSHHSRSLYKRALSLSVSLCRVYNRMSIFVDSPNLLASLDSSKDFQRFH